MQRRLACLTMQNAKGRESPATRPMTAASLLGVEPRASIAGPSARFDPRTPFMAYSVRRFFRFLSCTLRSAPSQCQQRQTEETKTKRDKASGRGAEL